MFFLNFIPVTPLPPVSVIITMEPTTLMEGRSVASEKEMMTTGELTASSTSGTGPSTKG